MNNYEKFLYWEGFRHGREWANSCHFGKDAMAKAEAGLMRIGITPLTPASTHDIVNAIREIV